MTIAGPSRSWTRTADGDTLATRVRCSYPTELPTHPCARRRHRGEGIGRLDAVIGADVDHHTRAIQQAGKEKIRRMPTATHFALDHLWGVLRQTSTSERPPCGNTALKMGLRRSTNCRGSPTLA